MLATAVAPLQIDDTSANIRSPHFTDSKAMDQKYAEAVQRLAELNIMTGTGENLFHPKRADDASSSDYGNY